MANEESFQNEFWDCVMPAAAGRRNQEDHRYLIDLVTVLRPHPAGLRRWAIMRAIRRNRETARLPIPQKMEDAVERVFRSNCHESDSFKKRDGAADAALFHWPQGKLGGVWAVYPERADAWLKAEGADSAR